MANRDLGAEMSERDLARSYGVMLGEVSFRLGDLKAARDSYQHALDIFAQIDSTNFDTQSYLAECYQGLGHLEESTEEFPAAVLRFEQGITELEDLSKDRAKPLDPDDQAQLDLRKQGAAVCKSAPRAIESLEFALGQPKEIVPELLGIRNRAMARRGKAQEAAAAADKLSALELADGRDLFHAATGFAICADGAQTAQSSARLRQNARRSKSATPLGRLNFSK